MHLFGLPSGKNEADANGDDDGESRYSYGIWFVSGVVFSLLAVWSTSHYEVLAKVAWSITAPGFTLSQTWNKMRDFTSRACFGLLLALHLCLVELVFPHLPEGHYGYILPISVAQIMTLGLAYQVWLHLRNSKHEL